ncbi:MAG: polysaccharide biosynthesis protein [Eubacterium sp.]|jgi:FlaA1/EpsC-like NDP-sugar epimerase|nr:polysaccharide biosynthesis protein [Eubacterium sp.]
MRQLFEDKKLWIRRVFLICYDIIAVFLAMFLALLARFDFDFAAIPLHFIENAWKSMPAAVITTLLIFGIFRLYSSLWSYAGAMEMMYVVSACIVETVVNMILILLSHPETGYPVPRSYYAFFGIFLFGLVFLCRYSYRAARSVRNMVRDADYTRNVLIIGAGESGNALIKEIKNSRYLKKRVVGVIDDNKGKLGGYIHGVKIVGTREDIIEKSEELHVHEIIVAMPSASPKQMKRILDICKQTRCELKRLPGIYQLVNGDVSISNLKEVDVNDLLGREPVNVDLDSIMGYVSGKTVMVTGGGGSIGSELCRQIASHNPKQLVIVDIYENSTYDIQNELKVKFPELKLAVLIASVRNTNRMKSIFETYRPDIIYHAAAHKHVPLMEDSPNEAVKNNVLGTWKLVRAADYYKVKRFVMISTDKAVNPTNVMGATKRICEMIIQTYNKRSKTEYVAVRFGNVLGSNGSVIPLFKKQIERGGPVTVTHPEIIRYFMTIPEAVSLVLQAGAYAKGGEIFILDMGEPVKILDLAKNLILLSGHKPEEDIQIVFTGLRPGEKLYEEMLMAEEGMQDTANRRIHIGKPIEFDEEKFLAQLQELSEYVVTEPDDIRAWISRIAPTYHPKEGV